MKDHAILLSQFAPIYMIDIIIIFSGWIIGNIIFNNFERHLPIYRRLSKLTVTVMVFYLTGIFLGRFFFYGLLIMMTIGQVILHAWYFPKHGINGLTAEPRDKYLELILKMKRRQF